MRHIRTILAFVLMAALPFTAPAATVTGTIKLADDSLFSGTIVFRPFSTPFVDNPFVITTKDITTTTTNGAFSVTLLTGRYRVFIGYDTKPVVISVPDDTDSHAIESLVEGGGTPDLGEASYWTADESDERYLSASDLSDTWTALGVTAWNTNALASYASAANWRTGLGLGEWTTNAAFELDNVSDVVLDIPDPKQALIFDGSYWRNSNMVDVATGEPGAWRAALGLGEWTTNSSSPSTDVTLGSLGVTDFGTNMLTVPETLGEWQNELGIVPTASAVVDTVADLDDTEVAAGKAVFVRGYHAAGDGGGGWFYASNTETNVDGVGLCFESATAGWAWNRVRASQDLYNVRWFGAKGDDTTNGVIPALQAISAAATGPITMYFPPGDYSLYTNVTLSTNISLQFAEGARLNPMGWAMYAYLTNNGSAYDDTLVVTVDGDVDAEVSATRGMITSLTLTAGGTGWIGATSPTVYFSKSHLVAEVGTTNIGGVDTEAVTNIVIVDGGYGYTVAPSISILGINGYSATNATATCQIDANGVITDVVITNPGFGYTNVPPVLAALDGTTWGICGTASVSSSGIVTNITLTDPWYNLTNTNSYVSIWGYYGSNATATATLSTGAVATVLVSNSGSIPHSKIPTLKFTSGGPGVDAGGYVTLNYASLIFGTDGTHSKQTANVQWFGARPDGTEIATGALRAAAAWSDVMYVPAGQYYLLPVYYAASDGTYAGGNWNCIVKLRSNMKVYGDGMNASKIRVHNIVSNWPCNTTNTHILMFWTQSTNLHLTNVTVRDIGLAHDNYTGAVTSNRQNKLFRVLSVNGGGMADVRVERVSFEDAFGFGIQCWYMGTTVSPASVRNDSIIADCVFSRIPHTGINIPWGPIERCYFSNVGQIIEGETRVFRGNYAIYCSQLNFNQGAFADTAESSGYYSIEDNVFMHCVPGGGIFAQIPSRSAVVRNNYFFDIDGAAIAIVPFTGYKPNAPTPIGESRRAVVQNNSFINCGSYYTSGGYKHSLLIQTGNNVIKDNYFGNTLHHTTYGWGNHGIQLSLSGTNNIFSGNVFKDVGKYYANNGCTNNVIVPDVLNRANWRYNEILVGVSNIYSGDLYTGPYEDSPFITAHPFSAPSNYVNGVASKLNAYPGSMYLSMGGGTNKTLWLNQSIAKGSTSSNNWNAVLTDAPRWIDSMVPAASMRLPSSGYPGLGTFTNGIECLKFDAASDESVHFALQLNHNAVKPTNTFKPHVHWTTSEAQSAATNSIVWGLEYTMANISSNFVGSTTIYCTNTPASQNDFTHTMTSFADITVTNLANSMIISCRLFRNADADADSVTGDANLLGFDMHYKVDSLGSEKP